MNKDIVNEDSSEEAKAIYGNSPEWKNFARRIQKNDFIREYLFDKYGQRCAFCGKPILLDRLIVHHITYQHVCITGESIEISHPTKKRPDRIRKVPNCESCQIINPPCFEACVSKLVPVHAYCNKIIDDIFHDRRTEHEDKSENLLF